MNISFTDDILYVRYHARILYVLSHPPRLESLRTEFSVAQSCPTLCNPRDYSPPGSSVHGDSPGMNTGVGCCSLLQGIIPTQESNRGLLHCRWILYCLSHQGSPRILEWDAMPSARGSCQPRNQTRVSRIAGEFFTS